MQCTPLHSIHTAITHRHYTPPLHTTIAHPCTPVPTPPPQCSLPGVDSTPLASRVVESQQWQLDMMTRRGWLESVLVCGGGSGIPGLTQRLVQVGLNRLNNARGGEGAAKTCLQAIASHHLHLCIRLCGPVCVNSVVLHGRAYV